MLQFNDRQMAQFGKKSSDEYAARTADILAEEYPEEAEARGRDGLEETVRYGAEVAETYGITHGACVYVYITLMLEFDDDFDIHPAYPWAARILTDTNLDQYEAVRRLFECVHREEVGDE